MNGSSAPVSVVRNILGLCIAQVFVNRLPAFCKAQGGSQGVLEGRQALSQVSKV